MTGLVLAFILVSQGAPAARPGVAAGQLQTIGGFPSVGIRVAAIPAPGSTTRPSDGQQYYTTEAAVSTALTDNQGRYRLTNIPPGRYFIFAGATYYPSTLDADRATVVTITPGSTVENLDFGLLRQLGGKVSGRVSPKPDPAIPEKAVISGVELDGLLEVPIGPDGAFEFGRVPAGAYLVDLAPTPPGLGAFRVQVGDGDVTGLEVVRPPTHAVTGRIVVQNGPLPRALLAFYSAKSYVNVQINPDGTFNARLHSARHRVDLAGMPGGYSVVSVRAGSQDVTQGFVVGNADLSGIIINVSAPRQLPRLRGQVTGLANSRLSSAKVEVRGPIIGSLETPVRQDGSFEFAALTPGMYSLRLPQVPELAPMNVVVSWNDTEVPIAVPAR